MRVRVLDSPDPELEGRKYCLTLADERFVLCEDRPLCLPATFAGTAEEFTLLLSGPMAARAEALSAMSRTSVLEVFPRQCECDTDHGRQALSLRECYEVCQPAVRVRLRQLEASGGRVTWDVLRCLRGLWASSQAGDPGALERAQLILLESAQESPVRYARQHSRRRRPRLPACTPPRRMPSGGSLGCLGPATAAPKGASQCAR